MKLLAYEVDKRPFLGVFNENETWAYPISAAGMEYRSMKDLIREAGPSEMETWSTEPELPAVPAAEPSHMPSYMHFP